jgi:hypothetical protein
MTKEYYCKYSLGGKECGENNPEKFEKSRYKICKKCRIKSISDKSFQRRHIDYIDKVKKIDPEEEIQTVVEYSIKCKNYGLEYSILDNIEKLNDNVKTISEKLNSNEEIRNELLKNFIEIDKNYQQVKIAFNLMREKIYEREKESIDFKKNFDIMNIAKRLKDLENFQRDILDEKNIFIQNNS